MDASPISELERDFIFSFFELPDNDWFDPDEAIELALPRGFGDDVSLESALMTDFFFSKLQMIHHLKGTLKTPSIENLIAV